MHFDPLSVVSNKINFAFPVFAYYNQFREAIRKIQVTVNLKNHVRSRQRQGSRHQVQISILSGRSSVSSGSHSSPSSKGQLCWASWCRCSSVYGCRVRVPKRRDSRVGWKRRARQQEKQNNTSTLAAGCSKWRRNWTNFLQAWLSLRAVSSPTYKLFLLPKKTEKKQH